MGYTDKTFFETLKPFVIQDMQQTGILASLTASQAYIESSKGNSGLTKQANNLFGIKGSYNDQSVRMWTTEYYGGIKQRVMADFRKYPSWQESIADHSGMFNRMARYKNLRGETDYIKACNNVHMDGYATSPTYSTTLLNCINKFKLYQWDSEALGRIVNMQTVKKVEEYYPVLKLGSEGEHVLCWQRFLNLSGYFCGDEDGIFGKNTRLAVIQWQKTHPECGKPDGVIGPKTWNSIPGIAAKTRIA